jgi:hypothetical protein
MRGCSTVTNLIEFSDFVIGVIEDVNQIDGMFTYFSKAFYRVNHSLLGFILSRSQEGPMPYWSYSMGRTPIFYIRVNQTFI